MPQYLVNKQADRNGYHEVHTTMCTHLPNFLNREGLGWYSNCRDAVIAAKRRHAGWRVDGCKHCSPNCHRH